MRALDINHLFGKLTFTKSASEIIEFARRKTIKVNAKIHEREKRVQKLRDEYRIDDAALIQLLTAARNNVQAMSFTYSMSNLPIKDKTETGECEIAAGVVNNILTENDFIKSEKNQVKTLDRIIRNLKPIEEYTSDGTKLPDSEFVLTTKELDYLGF